MIIMIQVNDPQPIQNYVIKTPRSYSKQSVLLLFSLLLILSVLIYMKG